MNPQDRARIRAEIEKILDESHDHGSDVGWIQEQLDERVYPFAPDHEVELLLRELVTSIEAKRDSLDGRVLRANVALSMANGAGGFVPKPVDEDGYVSDATGGPAANVDLMALVLLAHAGTARLPVDEATVARAMDGIWRREDDGQSTAPLMVGLLRTAAYFVLDADEIVPALSSEPPTLETFPPLPFRRVWIETRKRTGATARPHPLAELIPRGSESGGSESIEVLGVGIVELEQGVEWDVYLPFVSDYSGRIRHLVTRIRPDDGLDGEPIDAIYSKLLRDLTVGAAHLITARNVPHEALTLPRAQRKQLHRRHRMEPPTIYYVDLDAAGEAVFGSGTREYHCRWLVRGHWKHRDDGKKLCTCCDPPRIASWTQAHVKGPAGAPWKGRPIHATTDHEPASSSR